MKALLFLTLFSLNAIAAYENPEESYQLSSEEKNPTPEDILLNKSEKYLEQESMIYDLNSRTGINDARKYTGKDRNRLTGAYHINGKYEYYADLQAFEATYMRKMDSWHQVWWGLTARLISTQFETITENREAASGDNANADSQYQRPNDADQSLTQLGVGAGYRFKMFLHFLDLKDYFESTHVFLTYNSLNESFIKQTYRGYGLTADYGLHKRTRTNFFYGLKFTYNLAIVTREAIGSEEKDERTLNLGWFSTGFEAGYFF